jgi:hypothetical protein
MSHSNPVPEAVRAYIEGWHLVALFPNGAMDQCPVTFATRKQAEAAAQVLGVLAPSGVRYALATTTLPDDVPQIELYTRTDFTALPIDGKWYISVTAQGKDEDRVDEYILGTAYDTETEAEAAIERIAQDILASKGLGAESFVRYPKEGEIR